MATANATTNESGYHLHGGQAIGKPLTPSQLYSDFRQPKENWKHKESNILVKLRYHTNSNVTIGAMFLLEEKGYSAVSKCHIFTSLNSRAILMPSEKMVLIISKNGGFKLKESSLFKGVVG
jgi:hypothetical protein|tara:strand:+ start:611 stop:973 length:363 start_codon:yes stop_codon:yes gene_type:complete